jgi:hypothetical protein
MSSPLKGTSSIRRSTPLQSRPTTSSSADGIIKKPAARTGEVLCGRKERHVTQIHLVDTFALTQPLPTFDVIEHASPLRHETPQITIFPIKVRLTGQG